MGKNKPKKKGLKEEEARIRADSSLMRTSFLEQVRTPSLVNDTPSLVNDTPSLVNDTPSLVNDTPSLVIDIPL